MKLSATGVVMALAVAACATPPSSRVADVDVARAANELLMSHYRETGPGAVVLVARGDTILFRAARGEANIETHELLRPDSVFRIGSITKQFVAAGLMKLVEEGRVNLDDPLSRYIPDYPGGDGITLEQLLNHTSGVRNYNGLPAFSELLAEDRTTAQVIAIFRDEPPDFAPGERWAYSNSNYVLIGAVIESVSGMPWHAYLDQALFQPLGMRHTGFGGDPRFATQVQGYGYEGETASPIGPMSMSAPHAAGSLVSNVDDLLVWNRALHEGRVLHSEAYSRMITPTGHAANEGIRYGFGIYNGFVRGRQELFHGGRIAGFIAALNYQPADDITVIVLENDHTHNAVVDEAGDFALRLAALALGDPYPAMTPVPVDAAALQAFEGVYQFEGGVTRTLRVVDGRLTSQRGVSEVKALTPIGVDDFLYPDGFNRLRVERDAAGAVAAVRFFAGGDGEGERGVPTDQVVDTHVQLPRAAMERLVGVYENSELNMTVALEGETLTAQIVDQPAFRLLATSATQFDVEEAGAAVEFAEGEAPAVTLTIRQGGRETVLRRRP